MTSNPVLTKWNNLQPPVRAAAAMWHTSVISTVWTSPQFVFMLCELMTNCYPLRGYLGCNHYVQCVSHTSMSVYSSLEVSLAVGVCPLYLPANTYITTKIQPEPKCGCVLDTSNVQNYCKLFYTLNFLRLIQGDLNDFVLTRWVATKSWQDKVRPALFAAAPSASVRLPAELFTFEPMDGYTVERFRGN